LNPSPHPAPIMLESWENFLYIHSGMAYFTLLGMIPLRRVNTGFKALNPLRVWEKLAEPPRLGAPPPGKKTFFVPLSNYMNGSTTASTPKPPAPSGPMGPSLPFNMEPGA
uniref:Napsin A aspartic peptidase n=1 Tax=Moschus moschiferus TaxID=68415 RepID=A0A8C6CHX7_MOSMO